ncbi:MAG: dTMP kinase [Planctomycetota bacterium]|jgi:dTMP kinase
MSQTKIERQRGLFVVLDGVDGCGKSTQAQLLAKALGIPPELHLREPGSTALGEGLRALLLSHEYSIEPEVETLMFAAARRQTLDELVAPALARGESIVCERFHPSTYAYQSQAGDLDGDAVLALLHCWAGSPKPDLIILLDVDIAKAAARRGAATDRIEAKGLEFQERVAAGYRRYAEMDSNAVLVDGGQSQEEVHKAVMQEVMRVQS